MHNAPLALPAQSAKRYGKVCLHIAELLVRASLMQQRSAKPSFTERQPASLLHIPWVGPAAPVRGGFLRTAHERDIANISPDSRSAAILTLALVLLGNQAAAGSGSRHGSASCLTTVIGQHSGSVPGPARPAVTCHKSPEPVCGR